jgi:hypothetical protein
MFGGLPGGSSGGGPISWAGFIFIIMITVIGEVFFGAVLFHAFRAIGN